jgi:hypothetical protein
MLHKIELFELENSTGFGELSMGSHRTTWCYNCGSLPWKPPTWWGLRWPRNACASWYPSNTPIDRLFKATNNRNMHCCEQCFHLGPPQSS